MPSLQGSFQCCGQTARILKLLTRACWQEFARADNTDGVLIRTVMVTKKSGGSSDDVNGFRKKVLVQYNLGEKLP